MAHDKAAPIRVLENSKAEEMEELKAGYQLCQNQGAFAHLPCHNQVQKCDLSVLMMSMEDKLDCRG